MRLPSLPPSLRDLAERAADRLPVTVSTRTPPGQGLAAFDDVPCARIPVWAPPSTRPDRGGPGPE